jgi:benzoyl-CoA reductase subunit D
MKMITAGIDVGLENVKVVVLKDGVIAARAEGRSGCAGRGAVARELYSQALADAGIDASAVEKVVATGQGKFDVAFADKTVTEPVADAKALAYFAPDATMIVDAGADQVHAVPVGEDGKLGQLASNQKCSAGLGTLVRYLSRRLEIPIEEFSGLGAEAVKGASINDGCIVFAELDTLELLNNGVPKEQVAAAVNEIVAVRLNAIIHDKVLPQKNRTVLIGGITKNTAVVDTLKARSGIDFIIPEDAFYGCAVGAALVAAS